MKKIKLTIGADPEVFVKQGGKFVSAHGLVQGTKEQPFAVNKGAVQVDGMALEFNIDPAKNEAEFSENISTVMGILKGMVSEHEVVVQPTATFGAEYMSTVPEEALELGCEPDFNAWTGGKVNPKPNVDVDFRTGAGHIHIGWTEGVDITHPEHQEACQVVVKQLDWTLGMLSTVYDKDTKRRELYGNWGAYRAKPYGVEYRVLSNAWLRTPELVSWVYETVNKAVQDLYNGKHHYLDKEPNPKYVPYINMALGYALPPKG